MFTKSCTHRHMAPSWGFYVSFVNSDMFVLSVQIWLESEKIE